MYGWRGRIGSISATPTDTLPYEFYKMVPEGVTLIQTTLFIERAVPSEILAAEELVDRTALALAKQGAQVIVLGAAPMTFLKGPGADRALSERVSRLTGVPTISNQTAMMEALKTLGARRVVVASPLSDEILVKLKLFLEDAGFEVVHMKGLQIEVNSDIGRLPIYRAYQFAREVFLEAPQAEAILIPCAKWPVAPSIAPLERDLGVPVVASNQAKVWAALRALNIREPITGYGKLLAEGL